MTVFYEKVPQVLALVGRGCSAPIVANRGIQKTDVLRNMGPLNAQMG